MNIKSFLPSVKDVVTTAVIIVVINLVSSYVPFLQRWIWNPRGEIDNIQG